MNLSRVSLLLLAALILPLSLSAKGRTVKIEIKTETSNKPFEFTGSSVEQFNVWQGAGVVINGVPQTKGFIADWERGPVESRPEGRPVYEIFFAARGEDPARLVYVVLYDVDPITGEGYVYLGGHSLESHTLNTSSIYRRGLEGKRFRATEAWDNFIRPIVAPPAKN